jgi:hypothetical protein
MLYKLKYLIVLLLLTSIPLYITGQGSQSFGQIDTIIVYETITVYDTIFLYDTIKISDFNQMVIIEPRGFDLTLLQLDTINLMANLLIISKNQSATIPINSIILNENLKKQESMKKLSFLGVVAFAFQSMVIGQTDFGITAGVGTWWAKCNEPVAQVEFSPNFSIGGYLEIPVAKHLYLKTVPGYTYMMNNYSYKTEFDSINMGEIGSGESASAYHEISLPLVIEYQLGKFKPFIGMKYAYRISESWLDQSINCFGLLTGLNYSITDKLSLGLDYYFGLTKDFEYKETGVNQETGEEVVFYDYFWRSSSLGLTLSYSLKKIKPKD